MNTVNTKCNILFNDMAVVQGRILNCSKGKPEADVSYWSWVIMTSGFNPQ
jgi:hypothetical protein